MDLSNFIKKEYFDFGLYQSKLALEKNKEMFVEISPKVIVMTDNKDVSYIDVLTIHVSNSLEKLRKLVDYHASLWNGRDVSTKKRCIELALEKNPEWGADKEVGDILTSLHELDIKYTTKRGWKCTLYDGIVYIIPCKVEFQHAINLYTKCPIRGVIKTKDNKFVFDSLFDYDVKFIQDKIIEKESWVKRYFNLMPKKLKIK